MDQLNERESAAPRVEFASVDSPVGADIIVPEPPTETTHESPEEIIRAKIVATLKVYPVVSPSMLQAALGASLSPKIWKPTLDALIQEGTINSWDQSPEDEFPAVRQRPYPCLALAPAQSRAA